jgi:mono/diheme cytochrome c family protein
MSILDRRIASLMAVAAIGFSLSYGVAVHAEDAAKAPQQAADDQEEKPYKIIDGKVDFNTFDGYRRFGDNCARCHGEAATGSSFAPSLVDRLKTFGYDHFSEVVINGKQENTGAGQQVMPPFGMNPDVAENLDHIYAYVKGRSDGAIKPGRPEHLAKDDPRNDQ